MESLRPSHSCYLRSTLSGRLRPRRPRHSDELPRDPDAQWRRSVRRIQPAWEPAIHHGNLSHLSGFRFGGNLRHHDRGHLAEARGRSHYWQEVLCHLVVGAPGFPQGPFRYRPLSFLLGADVGPSFNQAQPSGINVNFSSSFVATAVYQITPVFSFLLPVRMLYIAGIGWNPIVEAGVIINLKNLPKAKQ